MNRPCPLSNIGHRESFICFRSEIEILSTNLTARTLGHDIDGVDHLILEGERNSIFFSVYTFVVLQKRQKLFELESRDGMTAQTLQKLEKFTDASFVKPIKRF